MKNSIRFIDSYGQARYFPRTHHALSCLRKRKPEHVLPEVLELLSRIHKRYSHMQEPTVRVEDLGFELNVHPATVNEVMKRLESQNVVEERINDGVKAFIIKDGVKE